MKRRLTIVCIGLLGATLFLAVTGTTDTAAGAQSSSSTGDLVFAGELQQVTAFSVAVRLDDGRIIDAQNIAEQGDLSTQSLSTRYAIGDQVRITCSPIGGVYYPEFARLFLLRLKALQLVRTPSKEERAKAMASRAWRESCRSEDELAIPCNLLRSSTVSQPLPPSGSLLRTLQLPDIHEASAPAPVAEWARRLELIRASVLTSVSRMPNFVADEVARRYTSATNPPTWRLVDTIDSEITFKGNEESRTHILLSGNPWSQPYAMLPGQKWDGGFGSELAALFNVGCPTTFESEGLVREGGRSFLSLRYSSPPDGCVAMFTSGYQRFFSGQTGRVLLDERGENVFRLEGNSQGFPKAFDMVNTETQVSWDYVQVGEARHLLPVSSDLIEVNSMGGMALIRQEYKNHRHFEASSAISFK